MKDNIKSQLGTLLANYNPENDIGDPRVTHSDWVLLDAILALITEVERLNRRLNNLSGEVDHHTNKESYPDRGGY